MPNTGALFVNQKKTLDKHPDYRGQVEIEGRKFWCASWVKNTGKGVVQSLSFEEFSEEDYRKSAELAVKKAEEAVAKAQQDAAQQIQNINSRWGAPQTSVQNPASAGSVEQPVHSNLVQPIQVQQVHSAPPVYNEPPADFDDDIPF